MKIYSHLAPLGLAAALALPAAVSTLHAQTATYTKIEDTNTQYPDVNAAYGQPHQIIANYNFSLVGNNLLFGAEDGFLTYDLYKATVAPTTFAVALDESTTKPGDTSGNTFSYSSGPSLDPTGTGNFVFGGRYDASASGSNPTNTATAIYTSNLASAPGVTTTLASTSTVAPGQSVTFANFGSNGSPSANISGTNVVFQGQYVIGTTAGRGIYATSVTGGTPTRLADYSTAAPSGGTFTSLTTSPQIRGNTAVFTASTNGASATGLYAANVSTGLLTTLVSTSTAVPGGSGNFTALNALTTLNNQSQATPAMNNTQVAFQGNYSGGTGVFRIGLDGTGLVSLGINTRDHAARHGRCHAPGRHRVFVEQHGQRAGVRGGLQPDQQPVQRRPVPGRERRHHQAADRRRQL